MRLFIKLIKNKTIQINNSVKKILENEEKFGVKEIRTYIEFQKKVEKSKKTIQEFFKNAKNERKKIVCYGAAAKGNTVLNFCKIGNEDIDYVVDISPHKQGKFLPGTHIPIFSPEKIKETKPDYIIILAWNLKEEIMKQINFIREWNGKFVFLIQEDEILK